MADSAYITDLEYRGFFEHQAPAAMNYVAALNGYEPRRIDGEFTYCELGCGRGYTSLVLAGTHPRGRFWACDMNAQHVQRAASLAEEGGVRNVTFLHRAIGDMLRADLPPFDFITLHGVYSWVSAEVREEIHAFLRAKLKPGGLAMVSYNAMPGWTQLQPVRRMMQTYASAVSGDSATKTRHALAYVRHLADNNATFFEANPDAGAHLKKLAEAPIDYVAHEYLTPHGNAFYFPEVRAAMHGAGLAFAGNMEPSLNYSELMVPAQFRELAASASTRVILETHRDFIANTRFRRDLYAAQAEVPRVNSVPLARLDALAFRLANDPSKLPVRGLAGGVQYDISSVQASAEAVHRRLLAGPATARNLISSAGGDAEGSVSTLVQDLVIAKHIEPCPPLEAMAAPGWSDLDAALLKDAVRKSVEALLVGKRSGYGHYFELTYASCIEASIRFSEPQQAAEHALHTLEAAAHELRVRTADGKVEVPSREQTLDYLSRLWNQLHDTSHPDTRFLKLVGVIA